MVENTLYLAIGLGVVAVYASLSLLFTCLPHLIHKKKKLGFSVQLTAHRGGAGENLENTLSAFKWAVEGCNADMLELDVQLTKDGQVVVAHDSNLLRSTGVNATIPDTDFADLPLLKQHLPLYFADGVCEKVCEDRNIPLLRDVMKELPKVAINIDLKNASDELIAKTAALIHEFKREKITPWGSSNIHVWRLCHSYDSSIPLYFSKHQVFLYPILFWTGLLAFLPIQAAIYETALPSIFLGRQFKNGWLMKVFGPLLSFLAEKFTLSRPYISFLERRGIRTVLWVLNSEKDYQHAYKLGAVGVHTDYPSKLREFISSNPKLCSVTTY
ncbi:lysophospholipase D GDPD1-like [Sycon ciliatum]|uniref:lysophospholipase D GDPD1-like n=1 Tax=Sycon ciliatum TaxID=27933 RepID=UPI0031F6E94C|eukprot:scpid31058/ scgid35251/ Glycerophosphodiester phosphodiesterase domain-containing protein 1; Glycerophosphodiester phosphodiesterase 4